MSTTVISELERFLKPIVEFVEPNSDSDESEEDSSVEGSSNGKVRFGHVQIPPYRLGKVSLLESVRQISTKANRFNAEMIFVVSDREKELGVGVNDDGKVTPVILTFSELIDSLRASKKGAKMAKWTTSPKPWKKGKALPVGVVLAICLDPHMSADCALCILGTVRWAIDQACDYDETDIRILTFSAEKEFNFLSEVVSFLSPDKHVASVNLAARGLTNAAHNSWVCTQPSSVACAGDILKKLRLTKEARRLILSFDETLEREFKAQLRDDEQATVEFRTVEATVSVAPLLDLKRSEKGPNVLFISFQGEVPFLPLAIRSFDELYVVMGTSGINKKAWDEFSRQTIELPHWASTEDRNLQQWWVNQPSIPSRFLYTVGQKHELFIEAGGPRFRLVENSHLGGFIASLADIASWGIDPAAALACFVSKSRRAQEMSLRLRTQGLTAKDGLGLGLSESEAAVFRSVASLLGYDHRLALFVALDSRSEVRRVKVQLAAMLKYSTDQVICIHQSVFDDRKKYNSVIRGCHGHGSSMARQGTMWLNLGLLKRHQKMAELQDADSSPEDTLSELVRVRSDRALLIATETGEILDRLVKLGVNVENDSSVAHESNELRQEAKDEISYHLVRSFTHNLVVTENLSANEKDAPRLSHKVMSTWLDVKQYERARLIEINSYVKKEMGRAFGIGYNFGWDKHGHPTLSDWTYIPSIVVAEWRSKFKPDVTFYEILNTDVERMERHS
ncbi:hypothetical protein FGLOB1_13917 [Fusarium globosum]|uniref:Uncharacterized protein n=1 Tax=Fusarium globosum TaxID=78864 RepID=A0A8H6CXT2_9HYPO|nr:hypothetical protein FGLOB1_13917 [Fusarium globosum]